MMEMPRNKASGQEQFVLMALLLMASAEKNRFFWHDVGSGTSVSSLQPDDVRALMMTRLWQICKIQTAQNEKTVFAGK